MTRRQRIAEPVMGVLCFAAGYTSPWLLLPLGIAFAVAWDAL